MRNILIAVGITVLVGAVVIFFAGRWAADEYEDTDPATHTISLYYPNSAEADIWGDECSPRSVVGVRRAVSEDEATPEGALELLLEGELTDDERSGGFHTEFPHDSFRLLSSRLENGRLTLEFDDPDGFSVGGSCRIGLLYASIERTVMQFPEVRSVVVMPEDIFQP